MVSSSRLGMPPFLRNSRLSSTVCSAFPPSEGNKLNNMQFTACPQVSSERSRRGGKKTLRPATQWVQISMPSLAYTSCRAGPKVLCSHYPGAHIARMQGWPDVLATVSSPLLNWQGTSCHSLPSEQPGFPGALCVQLGRCFGVLGNGYQHINTLPVPGHSSKRVRAAVEVFPLGSDVHLHPQPSIWNSGSHFSFLPINIADLLLYTWWVVNCIPPLL